MRSYSNGNGASAHNGNGPAGPYSLVCGMHLNPVPPRWQDMILDFGP